MAKQNLLATNSHVTLIQQTKNFKFSTLLEVSYERKESKSEPRHLADNIQMRRDSTFVAYAAGKSSLAQMYSLYLFMQDI